MPNWYTTHVKPFDLDAFKQASHYYDVNGISFQNIIPMPSSLEISSPCGWELTPRHISHRRHLLDDATIRPLLDSLYTDTIDAASFADVALDTLSDEEKDRLREFNSSIKECILGYFNLRRYDDCPTWYEWRIRNWGTKWDVEDSRLSPDGIVSFVTAWSMPLPILKKLSYATPLLVLGIDEGDDYVSSLLITSGTAYSVHLIEENNGPMYCALADAVRHEEFKEPYIIDNDDSDDTYSSEDFIKAATIITNFFNIERS